MTFYSIYYEFGKMLYTENPVATENDGSCNGS